ncbi:DUF1566 domain-containing protein [uncultured Sphaerochaeta sp.]|uniref:Lcl domain-containing protein n=1 Tax=uncultured Sphaerochaeta sp. TaxID=886478 RepID=UPI002A0A93F8|nr:DUF1566 domain-containing protein [uncultured Sphaerochaeta sp.]
MTGKTVRYGMGMLLALLYLITSISCSQSEPFGNLHLDLSVNGVPLGSASRLIGPESDAIVIAFITVSGYSDKGDSIEEQTFSINGSLQIKGLSVGTWHIGVTGLNSDELQITGKAVDDNVVIKSGKATTAVFNMQYLSEGAGSYTVTITWPSDEGWFSDVTLDLGGSSQQSVVPAKDAVEAVFEKEGASVGSYDLNLVFTNGSGTTISLPMMDTTKIYDSLVSTGSLELSDFDLVPVLDPEISIANQETVTLSCGTDGASIYYTTDGTDPVTSSTKQLYTAAFDVSSFSATIKAVGSCEEYRDSAVVAQNMDGSDPDGGIVITVPGTIKDLTISKESANTFIAAYVETGDEDKTILWYMDGVEQSDTDNDDSFTYEEGSLEEGRHQVMVKITKGDMTYAGSLRFSVDDSGIVIDVPGTIENLEVVMEAEHVFAATYTETGDDEKTILWYMDGVLQSDTDNDDSFTYTGTLTEDRHQVTVKIVKGGKTYAASLRFTEGEGGGGVVITEPGTIENLEVSKQQLGYVFTASYAETGEQVKTILWYMDGVEQSDTDNDDNFTYTGTLEGGRHQVTVKVTKDDKTYAGSIRFTVYDLGSTGPSGGIIVMVSSDVATDGWSYMEAAPVDEGIACTWSEAIQLCSNATYDGYVDWMLPSKENLQAIYEQKSVSTGFASSWYWSSDEDATGNKAWQLNFGTGLSLYYTKSGYNHVRAVRVF